MRVRSGVPVGVYREHFSGGYTLVELIVTIALVGTLAAVGSSMIADSFMTTRRVNADTAALGQAGYAVERLAREIREINFGTVAGTPCLASEYCITSPGALPSVLNILSPPGSFGFINGAGKAVTITGVSPNTVKLDVSPPGSIGNGFHLAGNVITLEFGFETLDEAAADKGSVRFVRIHLIVTDPESGQPIELRTRVSLRGE